MLDWLIARMGLYLLEPFQSVGHVADAVNGLYRAAVSFNSKTAWPYLLASLVVALIVHRVAVRAGVAGVPGSFRRYVFPRDVYLHRSALVDYRYVAVDLTVRALLFVPLIGGLSALLYRGLLGAGRVVVPAPIGALAIDEPLARVVVFTLGTLVVADFGFFLSHWLMHRSAVLWPFHEVHHSAEVLTPVTVYRVHPVEDFVTACTSGVVSAAGALLYTATFREDVDVLSIYGVNAAAFVFFLAAFQLRHSHVWLSYGPVVSRIFISPAQHQIHHSRDPKHWNRNYGFILALWDVAWGTLYVPRTRESLAFGLPDSDPRDFDTVRALYVRPFAKALRAARRARDREPRPALDRRRVSS